jgi:hypothetical protein
VVDTDHSPTDIIRGLDLADRIAQDGADRVRSADKDQGEEGQEEISTQAKNNGGDAEEGHRTQQQLALAADVGPL